MFTNFSAYSLEKKNLPLFAMTTDRDSGPTLSYILFLLVLYSIFNNSFQFYSNDYEYSKFRNILTAFYDFDSL